MKKNYELFAYTLALFIAGGCAPVKDVILESKDVQFFKVEELQRTPTRLKISGLAFKSAMSVSEITTKTTDSAIVIQVHLTLAKPGTSGSFAYELPVPESVREVRFGTSAAPIWKRGALSTPSSSAPVGEFP